MLVEEDSVSEARPADVCGTWEQIRAPEWIGMPPLLRLASFATGPDGPAMLGARITGWMPNDPLVVPQIWVGSTEVGGHSKTPAWPAPIYGQQNTACTSCGRKHAASLPLPTSAPTDMRAYWVQATGAPLGGRGQRCFYRDHLPGCLGPTVECGPSRRPYYSRQEVRLEQPVRSCDSHVPESLQRPCGPKRNVETPFPLCCMLTWLRQDRLRSRSE